MQQGFYCLQDYAVAHWYDHVQSWLDMATRTNLSGSLPILQSSLVVFLSRRWDGSTEQPKGNKKVPAKIVQKLRLLKDPQFQGVFLKLTRFQAACESLPIDTRIPFLNFSTQVRRARIFLESEQQYPLEQYYGPKFSLFKCSRENCLHFSEGFQSSTERDEHELKHERPFTCPEVACLKSSIGFPSQRDLQSHIKSQHPENAHIYRQQEDEGYTINDAYGLGDPSIFIIEAAEEGHFQTVQTLVDSGADVNVRDLEGMTALHRASANGHIDIVRFLTRVPGIMVPLLDATRSTALHLAIHSGHAQVVAYLLDLYPEGAELADLFHAAAQGGFQSIRQLLLDFSSGLDHETIRNALVAAVLNGHLDEVLDIMAGITTLESAPTNLGTEYYTQALEAHVYNTTYTFNTELIRLLVVYGARVPLVLDGRQPQQTWLHHATKHGMIEPVRLLTGYDSRLGVVIPISAINDTGATALDIAATSLQVEIMRYLLEECHARFTLQRQRHILFDILWPTTYSYTLRRSDIPALNVIIRLLFQYHEELHLHTTGAIIMRAIEQLKHFDMEPVPSRQLPCDGDEWFALLIVKCDLEDRSALMELVTHRRTAYVRLLLEKKRSHVYINAQMRLPYSIGFGTPLDYSCYKGFLRMVRVLLDHAADSFEPRWSRALGIAASNGYACIIKMLLEHGANPNAKSEWSNTDTLTIRLLCRQLYTI